jgi:hypothetical protein
MVPSRMLRVRDHICCAAALMLHRCRLAWRAAFERKLIGQKKSGGRAGSGTLPLPAPAEQAQRAEAAGKERESGGERRGRRHRIYCL